MRAKLTLELEQDLLERAERHAAVSGKSVSQLVADYFTRLGQKSMFDEASLPPITRSLCGLLKGAEADEAKSYKHHEQRLSSR